MSIFDELAGGVTLADEASTRAFAGRLAVALSINATLALSGDLGAGKTTFVKGLAAAWNVKEAVTSPSFALCNIHRGSRLLVHVDAYRLTHADAWDGLMVEEFLRPPWCLAIEWPERIRDRLPADSLWLRFESGEDDSRTLRSVPDWSAR